MTKILDGRKIAAEIIEKLKKQTAELKQKGIVPYLVIILVGENPQSIVFVNEKIKKAKEIKAKVAVFRLDEKAQEREILNQIEELNQDKNIQGIVVQLPLPAHLNREKILAKIEKRKDVDGLHWPGFKKYFPPTPKAVLSALSAYRISLKNKKIALLGKGRLVGEPLYLILREKNLKVTVCDSKTKNIKEIAKTADILISATGVAGLVKKDWVKKGAVVVDCAFDVDREIEQKTAYITPKIGGIGPLTVVFLFENLIKAAKTLDSKN